MTEAKFADKLVAIFVTIRNNFWPALVAKYLAFIN